MSTTWLIKQPNNMNTTTSAPVPSPEFAKLIEIEMKRLEAMFPENKK